MESKCAKCRFGVAVSHVLTENILKPSMKKAEEWLDDDDESNFVPDPTGDPVIKKIEQDMTTSFCYYHPSGEAAAEPVASFQNVKECSVFEAREV